MAERCFGEVPRMAESERERAEGALRRWARRVDRELDQYRNASVPFGNVDRIPKTTWAPHEVQWYQHRAGPHRWVLCGLFEDRDDMASAFFWTEPRWEDRDAKVVRMDAPSSFAMDVWHFLKPISATELAEEN